MLSLESRQMKGTVLLFAIAGCIGIGMGCFLRLPRAEATYAVHDEAAVAKIGSILEILKVMNESLDGVNGYQAKQAANFFKEADKVMNVLKMDENGLKKYALKEFYDNVVESGGPIFNEQLDSTVWNKIFVPLAVCEDVSTYTYEDVGTQLVFNNDKLRENMSKQRMGSIVLAAKLMKNSQEIANNLSTLVGSNKDTQGVREAAQVGNLVAAESARLQAVSANLQALALQQKVMEDEAKRVQEENTKTAAKAQYETETKKLSELAGDADYRGSLP